MQIGVLAKKVGVNPKTIRYYEQIGLLPPAQRTESGYRDYTARDVERLEFVRSARAVGVALDEIKEVLAFRARGVSPCRYVLGLIKAKVTEIESRIQGLRMMARELKRLQRAAATLPERKIAAKSNFCHIIENQKLVAGAEKH